jgi:hypothetical protein
VNLFAGGYKMQSLLKSVFESLSLDDARRECETYCQERAKIEEKARQADSNLSPWGTAPLTTYSPDHLQRAGLVEFSSEEPDCIAVVVAKGIYKSAYTEGLCVTQFCVPVYTTLPGSEEKLWLQEGGRWKTEAQLNMEYLPHNPTNHYMLRDTSTALTLKSLLLTGFRQQYETPFHILPGLAKDFISIKGTIPTRTGLRLTELARYAVAWFDELPGAALCGFEGGEPCNGEGVEAADFAQRRFSFKTPTPVALN